MINIGKSASEATEFQRNCETQFDVGKRQQIPLRAVRSYLFWTCPAYVALIASLVLAQPGSGEENSGLRTQSSNALADSGFVSMFDGKTLDGWKVSDCECHDRQT